MVKKFKDWIKLREMFSQNQLDRDYRRYYQRPQKTDGQRRYIECHNCDHKFVVPMWLDAKTFTCPKCKKVIKKSDPELL